MITTEAVEAYGGDLKQMQRCGLIFLGRIRCTPDCDHVRGLTRGGLVASHGGTNFVSDGVDYTETGTKSTGSAANFGYGNVVAEHETHSTGYTVESLRVYRIDRRSKYECLETSLRPAMEF